jgi:hypothetical protein
MIYITDSQAIWSVTVQIIDYFDYVKVPFDDWVGTLNLFFYIFPTHL